MRKLFLLGLLALIVFFQINGEKIPVNEGAYGDGVFYRDVGRFFLDDIENSGYNLVQLTRILPFALLNLTFSTFHIVKDNEGLQHGMIIWQVLYLALACYWFFRIAKKLRLKTALMTLGFILIFFNFAWLKSIWYHPFSPDLFAFALGMGQANYFLRYEKFKLGMVSIIGAFVSPLLLISGLLMLFLPGDKLPLYEGERPKTLTPAILSLIIPVLVAVLGWGVWGWGNEPFINQLFHGLAILAIPPVLVFGAIQNTVDWDLGAKQLKKRTKTDKLSRGIMAFVGIFLVLILLSGQNEGLGVFRFMKELGIGSFRFPFDFIISFSLQWGLLALLSILFLKRMIQEMSRMGWPAVLVLSLGLVFAFFFKVNALAAWVPLWGVVVIKALKRYRWGNKDLILAGIAALILSLFWLPLNSDALTQFLKTKDQSILNSWQVQKWAMHFPEFYSLTSFGVIVILIVSFLWFFYNRRKKYLRILSN